MRVTVTTNLDDLIKTLSKLEREQLPFASAVALTRTAERVQFNEKEVMRDVFDAPTPWTMNSLFVDPAEKRDWPKQSARTWFKDFAPKGTAANDYLQAQVSGGPRKHKRSEKALIARGIMKSTEYAIPGNGAQLDPFGNMKKGQIVKMLSDLRAFSEVGYLANRSASKRSTAKASGYFFADIDGTRGIWQRVKGWSGGVRSVLVFVSHSPKYRKRFPFWEVAENTTKAHYGRIFEIELNNAVTWPKQPRAVK